MVFARFGRTGDGQEAFRCAVLRFKPEEIVAKLRQVEVLQGQGSTVADAIRQIGVTEVTYCEVTYYEVTYYRWRREYGGMKTDSSSGSRSLRRTSGIVGPYPISPWTS